MAKKIVNELADLLDKVGTTATDSEFFKTALQRALENISISSPTRDLIITTTSTLTPDVDNYDLLVITAQVGALTIEAPIGTPTNGSTFVMRIKGDGSAVTFDPIYRAIGSALITTITSGKTIYITAVYNSTDTRWDVFSSNTEV